jgi:hypothetical protein
MKKKSPRKPAMVTTKPKPLPLAQRFELLMRDGQWAIRNRDDGTFSVESIPNWDLALEIRAKLSRGEITA